MRTEEGDEIIEPGDYELSDERTLRVYLTKDADETLHMWACTHCQEVDGVTNALLVGVIDGTFDVTQDDSGEFRLGITKAGEDAVKALFQRMADESAEEERPES
jgi:hypothetical protein